MKKKIYHRIINFILAIICFKIGFDLYFYMYNQNDTMLLGLIVFLLVESFLYFLQTIFYNRNIWLSIVILILLKLIWIFFGMLSDLSMANFEGLFYEMLIIALIIELIVMASLLINYIIRPKMV